MTSLASLLCLLVCLSVSAWTGAGMSSSEGTRFVIALPGSSYDRYDAELMINARQTTDVTVTGGSTNDAFTVHGNWSIHYQMDYDMRVTDGTEFKGIVVTSVEPVTIHVASVSSAGYSSLTPGACIARPVSDSLQYYLAGYHEGRYSTRPQAFYSVVATEDNTDVSVYYTDDVTLEDEEFNLSRYQVFTRDTYYMQMIVDLTGTRIVSNKPIAVYAGIGAVRFYAPGAEDELHYLFESMPSMDDLGTEYTSFSIHFGDEGGYEVRVIGTAADTDVSIPAFSAYFTLDAGEFFIVDNTLTRYAFGISCSKPCMAVQYVRCLPRDDDTDTNMSAFLAVLTPDERLANDLIFTVPSHIDHTGASVRAAISIIMDTFPPRGLHLNDTNLEDLNWQPAVGSPNFYSTVEIERGFYHLHSTEPSEMFTAYLYVLQRSWPAVGFPIGYGVDATGNSTLRLAFHD